MVVIKLSYPCQWAQIQRSLSQARILALILQIVQFSIFNKWYWPQGGLVADIADIIFDESLKDISENVINIIACQQLELLGTGAISDLLKNIEGVLKPYLGHTSTVLQDVLDAESNLVVPPDVQLIDFQ